MTILEYLKKLFRNDSTLAHYDISEGSNYYDLVFKTMDKVLNESVLSDLIGWADIYDINNLDNLTYNDVAHIAAQYGIPAPFVNYSSGDVKLIFNAPVDVSIPEGTMFSANNVVFMTTSYESILGRYLESNTRTTDGKYQSQPITVYNLSGQNVGANTLGIVNLSIPQLARIENNEISNGTTGADKLVLSSIIRGVVKGIATGTEESITALMRHLCPDIYAVQVVSSGDDLMTRDMMVNAYIYGDQANNQQSYFNKVYGNNITNKNLAYRGTSFSATPPDIDALYGKTELSQYQYINIGSDDTAALSVSTDNEFVDTFSTYNNFGATGELDCGVTTGEDYFYAYGAYWIEPGSSVNIEGVDDEDLLHKTQVIVRDVVGHAINLVSISYNEPSETYTAVLDSEATDVISKIKEGQIIELGWVKIVGEEEYSATITVLATNVGALSIDFMHVDPLVFGTCDEIRPGKAIWQEYQIVGSFVLSLTEVIASVPDDISTQIGGGWIVSEHGYPVGMKVANNEVYVENERLVMGGDTGSIQDPMRDVVLKGGVGRFIASVLRAMSIKRPGTNLVAVPIVNNDEVMDR